MKATRKTLKPSDNTIYSNEANAELFGVSGRFGNRIYDRANGLFVNQKFLASRPFKAAGYKANSRITVELSFDDNCKNGSQVFHITAEIREPGMRDVSACGCLHDEVAAAFPEFAHLIKWHGVHTFGPWYYLENTLYMAGTRDSSGREAGQPSAFKSAVKFGAWPILYRVADKFGAWISAKLEFNRSATKSNPARVEWRAVPVAHVERGDGPKYEFAPKFTLEGFAAEWYQCPFDTVEEANEFCAALTQFESVAEVVQVPTAYSKGKARELDAARRSAVWLDATDEQLSVPRADLERALLARLPGLVAAFRADMDACGLHWREVDATEADANK